MKTFEIHYVGRYVEHKEYYTETVKARTQKSALNKFGKPYKLKAVDLLTNETWWDGDWLMEFRSIREVKEQTCSNCNGQGKIVIA
jgi:hypothetical protein